MSTVSAVGAARAREVIVAGTAGHARERLHDLRRVDRLAIDAGQVEARAA